MCSTVLCHQLKITILLMLSNERHLKWGEHSSTWSKLYYIVFYEYDIYSDITVRVIFYLNFKVNKMTKSHSVSSPLSQDNTNTISLTFTVYTIQVLFILPDIFVRNPTRFPHAIFIFFCFKWKIIICAGTEMINLCLQIRLFVELYLQYNLSQDRLNWKMAF